MTPAYYFLYNSNVEAFETLIKDPEVKRQFEKNIKRLQSYTNTFLFTVFENFQSVPISIRVLCKIISVLAKQKVRAHTIRQRMFLFMYSSQKSLNKSMMLFLSICSLLNGSTPTFYRQNTMRSSMTFPRIERQLWKSARS